MSNHTLLHPKPVPDSYRDLIDRPIIAALATVLSDGTPQVTPVWFDVEDGYFFFNTASGRVKHKAMAKTPYVALMILDPKNPYRYLAVRGPIVETSEEEGRAHIDRLSKRYTGRDKYQSNRPDEIRVRYKMSPQFVSAMG